MPRSVQKRHPNKETPEPVRWMITSVIQFAVGCLLLLALFLIVEYVTDPQVLTFDFLFR